MVEKGEGEECIHSFILEEGNVGGRRLLAEVSWLRAWG